MFARAYISRDYIIRPSPVTFHLDFGPTAQIWMDGWSIEQIKVNLSTFNSVSPSPASFKTALFSIFGKQMKPTWQTSFISTSGDSVFRIQDFPFSNWF